MAFKFGQLDDIANVAATALLSCALCCHSVAAGAVTITLH
jgi:hypothetical protein